MTNCSGSFDPHTKSQVLEVTRDNGFKLRCAAFTTNNLGTEAHNVTTCLEVSTADVNITDVAKY